MSSVVRLLFAFVTSAALSTTPQLHGGMTFVCMIPSTLHPAQLQLPLYRTGRRARSAQTAQKKKDANMLHSSFPQMYSMLNIHRPFTEQQQYASPQLPEYCSTSSQRLNCPPYISPPPLKQEKADRRHENQKTDPLQSPLLPAQSGKMKAISPPPRPANRRPRKNRRAHLRSR